MTPLLALVCSFLISFTLTPLVRNFFIARHFIEDPQKKQQLTQNATALRPVPRGGGISIFIAILFSSLFFIPLDKHLSGILLAAFFTLIIGVWDDLKDLSPKLRLVANIAIAAIVIASGIGIAYISNPFGGIIDLSFLQINFNFFGPHSIWLLSDLLALFWIVWCMNIVGWSAGVDGQLPGFVAISAIFIAILGLRYSSDTTQIPLIVLSLIIAGSYLGFLPYNFFPQSIMPGYSGKSLAGFLLAVLSILSGAKLATLIFLLGVPMFDAIFVLAFRLIKHHSLLRPNNVHLHHRLLKLGWNRRQIALLYWGLSLILGLISLLLNSTQKFYVLLGLAFLFLSFILKLCRRT